MIINWPVIVAYLLLLASMVGVILSPVDWVRAGFAFLGFLVAIFIGTEIGANNER